MPRSRLRCARCLRLRRRTVMCTCGAVVCRRCRACAECEPHRSHGKVCGERMNCLTADHRRLVKEGK